MGAAARHIDEPIAEHGPCMSQLNARQQTFVRLFVTHGNATLAVRQAGYGTANTDDDCFGRLGWQLKHRPAVAAAIEEVSRKTIRVLAAPAVARLARIISDPKSRDCDALKAIDLVLLRTDPAGQLITVAHQHDHHIRLSADQITKRIMELAARVGVDVKPLPPPIDAVAEEVPA